MDQAAPNFGLTHTYADTLTDLYAPVEAAPPTAPSLVWLNEPLYAQLGLPVEAKAQAAQLFSGAAVPADARPIAQAYSGHQFGGFSPVLGDGRALLLGERVDATGARWDIHMKGSGRTPFSRGGDGRATLGPMLREVLISEAMHALGIRTSRMLAVTRTGDQVMRARREHGAVLTRVASSHLRVGTLQFVAAHGERALLERLVVYTLERHYPERVAEENPAWQLLEAVAVAQARLIASWMLVGFVHGVMNTDNFTLTGETIDYGPCAFMDTYDHTTCFSSIDHHGRYAYGNQPGIGRWNLARMGEALLALLDDEQEKAIEMVHGALDIYVTEYETAWLDGMRRKLGLEGEDDVDGTLATDLLEWMQAEGRDYTSTFRQLAEGVANPIAADEAFLGWHERWRARHGDAPSAAIRERLRAANPAYIPRNHLVEEALGAAHDGEMAPFEELLAVLQTPFEDQPGKERYAAPSEGDGRYVTFCGT